MGGQKSTAHICGNCSFGSKKDNCVKCDKWMANQRSTAHICGNCCFGSKKDNCVKCGKWMGWKK